MILGVVFVVLWRQLVLGKLYRVSTREPQTYTQLCWVVRLLGGDESRVQWVATKDRALAAGRKHKARIKKIEAELQERARRKAALATIKKKMEHTLARRRKEREQRERREEQHTGRTGWGSSLFSW